MRSSPVDLHSAEPWLTWRLLQGGAPPEGLLRQALRTRAHPALEALARTATRGAQSALTLREHVLLGHLDLQAGEFSPVQIRALAGTAMVWAGSMQCAPDLEAAARIFSAIWEDDRVEDLSPQHHLVGAQTLFLAGHHLTLSQLLPHFTELSDDAAHYLRTDLLNPFTGMASDDPAPADQDRWRQLFGQWFVSAGLAPPTVLPAVEGAPAFDLLDAPGPRAGSVAGELVTVVMPCYRPDRGLLTSVRSISAQTWADLEIIVVDDASGPGYAELFAQAVALDPRARLLQLSRNGGSYLGREAAIADSSGTLVTFQDADDWSHPSRIEHQVAVLRERDAPMSRSHAIRAKDDLTHQWLGYRPFRPNASSLLVRREVLERCGGFLPVRKGADSEFAERISLLAGPIADTLTPLAVTRLRSGSLSRGDFTFSWSAPDRISFRSSFMSWHRQLAARRDAGEHVTVSTADLHAFPFPVPPTWVRELDGAGLTPTSLPVAYLGNFSGSAKLSPTMRWLQNQLTDRLEHQPTRPQGHPEQGPTQPEKLLAIGLWHQEPPWSSDPRRPLVSQAWFDLIVRHKALRPVTRVDPVVIERLVVVDPGVLSLMTGQECTPQVQQVEVWLTPKVVEPDASLLPEDLLGAADTALSLFGRRPRWVLAPQLTDEEQCFVLDSLPGLEILSPTPC